MQLGDPAAPAAAEAAVAETLSDSGGWPGRLAHRQARQARTQAGVLPALYRPGCKLQSRALEEAAAAAPPGIQPNVMPALPIPHAVAPAAAAAMAPVLIQVHFPFNGPFGDAMTDSMRALAESISQVLQRGPRLRDPSVGCMPAA